MIVLIKKLDLRTCRARDGAMYQKILKWQDIE